MISLALGVNYSWGDVALMLFGNTPILGITAIEYSEDQDMENNYGAGNFPIGQGFGNFKYNGKIRLYQEEIQNIVSLAAFNKVQTIPPFNIKVVRGNTSQAIVTDTLFSCVFKKNMLSTKNNDKKIETDMELLIGGINWGSI